MIDNIAQHILGLHGFAALAIVCALPLLESSAFVGFVVPGEIAVVLGGVLAFQHRVSLPAVLAAAIAGAIIGDTVGYAVGHRYGRRLLAGRLGRRIARFEHVDRAGRYLAERGGKAVLLGRFTAALRVLIPGLAGMARMPYRTFLFYNVTGGVLWATVMVLLGYLGGASWQRAAHWASELGLAALAVIVVVFVLRHAARATRKQSARLHAVGARLASTGPAVWTRRRFPAQLAWLRRRLDPTTPYGLALTATVAAAALAAWIFGGITQDVAASEGAAQVDSPGHAFAVDHRAGWLTAIMFAVTWLGSGWLLVPVLVVATIVMLRRRNRRNTGWLWAAYLGAVALYALAKPLVQRSRPPTPDLLATTSGLSYPSGHATQAVAVWGMLAVVVGAGRSARVRVGAFAAAAAVVLPVGASRIYLGTHWPTDVLAGYALGAAWLAVLLALRRRRALRTSSRRRPGQGRRPYRGLPPPPATLRAQATDPAHGPHHRVDQPAADRRRQQGQHCGRRRDLLGRAVTDRTPGSRTAARGRAATERSEARPLPAVEVQGHATGERPSRSHRSPRKGRGLGQRPRTPPTNRFTQRKPQPVASKSLTRSAAARAANRELMTQLNAKPTR